MSGKRKLLIIIPQILVQIYLHASLFSLNITRPNFVEQDMQTTRPRCDLNSASLVE